jgi:hypothetical protein
MLTLQAMLLLARRREVLRVRKEAPMKACQHNVQKRLAMVDVASIAGIAMWCINCGGLKLGSSEWQLPLMKPPDSISPDSQKPESD